VSNVGSSSATVSAVTLNNTDYMETDNCVGTLASGAQCTITVVFSPTITGADNATLTISSNPPSSPNTVSITGSGTTNTVQFSWNNASDFTAWDQINKPRNVVINSAAPLEDDDLHNASLHYHICGVPSAPTLSDTSAGSLAQTTYYVKITGVNAGGETTASSETSRTVSTNRLLTVTLPPAEPDLTGDNVYVGTSSGSETLQTASAISQGSTWTEPTTGLVFGASPPTTFTATCGASIQDTNQWMGKSFAGGGLNPIFIRAWVYFSTPQGDDNSSVLNGGNGTMRKIFYPFDVPSPANWVTTLVSFEGGGQVRLSPACCGTQWYNVAQLNFNTWHSIEFETLANTPGASDGSMTVWVNGTQVWTMTGLNIRGTNTDGIGWIQLGAQAQRQGSYQAVDEYRYMGDVYVATSYIGP